MIQLRVHRFSHIRRHYALGIWICLCIFVPVTSEYGQTDRVSQLISQLNDTNPNLQQKSALELGEIKDPRAVEPLIAALKDPNCSVRLDAIWALGEIKDPRAVEPLIAALKDLYCPILERAISALGKIKDPRAVEPLIAVLKDDYCPLQGDVVRALWKIKDRREVNPLIDAASNGPGLNARDPQHHELDTYRRDLARKAEEKVADCKFLGDRPINLMGAIILWDIETGQVDSGQWLIDNHLQYPTKSNQSATVFLVSAKQPQQVGTYSISRQPAYLESADVYVVQFHDLTDGGTAVAAHHIFRNPAGVRAVSPSPEYGEATEGLVDWISSLPVKCVESQSQVCVSGK